MADIMAGGDEQPMRGPQPQGGMDPGLMAMVQAVLAKVGPQMLAQVLQMLLRQGQGQPQPQPMQRPPMPPGPGGPPGAGMGMMGPQ